MGRGYWYCGQHTAFGSVVSSFDRVRRFLVGLQGRYLMNDRLGRVQDDIGIGRFVLLGV